jgi:hypothetical protein
MTNPALVTIFLPLDEALNRIEPNPGNRNGNGMRQKEDGEKV